MSDEVKKFGVYIQPTLPLHITDEVSFLEMLLKFQAKLNELIDYVNDLELNANNYTDAEIAKLRAELMSQITYLKDQIGRLDGRIDNIGLDWDIKLKQTFDRLIYILNLSQNLQDIEWANSLRTVYNEIVDMLIYGFPVVDPTTGKTTTVQIALNNLYNIMMNQYGITVEEYESLNLTVDEYEIKFISVYDYVNLAKDTIFTAYFSPYFNPFNGKRTSLQVILNMLASFHIDNPTVDEYEAFNITVDDYESHNVSVEDYSQFVG